MSTWQQRLAASAALLLERVPDDLRAECEALIDLDPDVRGLTLAYEPEVDRYALLWTGRWLGSIDGPWLRDGDPEEIP